MKRYLMWMCLWIGQIAWAGGGLLGMDHVLQRDDTGVWSRSNQQFLEYASAAVVVGGALWEGKDSRLGRTFWQSADAMTLTAGATAGAKLIFQRERPTAGDGPDEWFKGSRHRSFPSGEVAHISAIVTPFIAEYADDHPMVWALAALPVYDAVARMKSQAHWQSDVLVGAALGTAIGLYARQRDESVLVSVLPGGVSIGLRKRF